MPGSRSWPLALVVVGSLLAAAPGLAEGPHRNRDNEDPKDLAEGTYPIPYQKPTLAEITEVLGRVRGYLEAGEPNRVVDGRTGALITDFSVPNPEARIPDGGGEAFYPLDYTMEVTHWGMLLAADVTGDARFADYTSPAAVHQGPAPVLPRGPARRPARKRTFGAILATGSTTRSTARAPTSRRAGLELARTCCR